jgi:predicted nuclease of restriction endonuclease-like RecB superfamily
LATSKIETEVANMKIEAVVKEIGVLKTKHEAEARNEAKERKESEATVEASKIWTTMHLEALRKQVREFAEKEEKSKTEKRAERKKSCPEAEEGGN